MLADSLKTLLATEYAFTIKAQQFHWNVEGPDFGQLHKFFMMIYDDVYAAIDPIAEYIRALNEYTPGSFERFGELSVISGQTKIPRARLMLEELLANNGQMLDLLTKPLLLLNKKISKGLWIFLLGVLTHIKSMVGC
jgi:starvation-inducible DNA-binding protein